MKNVISLKDLERMQREGKSLSNLPEGAILTPSARDFLNDLGANGDANGAAVAAPAGSKEPAFIAGEHLAPPPKKLNSKSPKTELEAFFRSPYAQSLKEQICTMGKRLWEREYVDGNGGNMAIRVGEDIAI